MIKLGTDVMRHLSSSVRGPNGRSTPPDNYDPIRFQKASFDMH